MLLENELESGRWRGMAFNHGWDVQLAHTEELAARDAWGQRVMKPFKDKQIDGRIK